MSKAEKVLQEASVAASLCQEKVLREASLAAGLYLDGAISDEQLRGEEG
jgi:hypothetical protein